MDAGDIQKHFLVACSPKVFRKVTVGIVHSIPQKKFLCLESPHSGVAGTRIFHFLFAMACSENLCREGFFKNSCVVMGTPSLKLRDDRCILHFTHVHMLVSVCQLDPNYSHLGRGNLS